MAVVRVPGAEIAYSSQGDGEPVLFLQGVGLAGCAWQPQTDALRDQYRCIAIDNRGLGQSTGDTSALNVELMARDAWAVADALSLPRVHLVGHSLGGVILQAMALSAPERVQSLTFMCTFAGGHDLARPTARLIWYGARSRIGTRDMRRHAFARLVMPPAYIMQHGIDATIALLERAFGRNLADAPALADLQLKALRAYDRRRELAVLTNIPSIVLSGKLDPIASHAANAELAQRVGAQRHQTWDDASHALPIQHVDAVNAVLRVHLAGAQNG